MSTNIDLSILLLSKSDTAKVDFEKTFDEILKCPIELEEGDGGYGHLAEEDFFDASEDYKTYSIDDEAFNFSNVEDSLKAVHDAYKEVDPDCRIFWHVYWIEQTPSDSFDFEEASNIGL